MAVLADGTKEQAQGITFEHFEGVRIVVGISHPLPLDAKFLAVLDLGNEAQSSFAERYTYWVDRLSSEEGRRNTFIAHVGSLYAGYIALNGDPSNYSLMTNGRYAKLDIAGKLMRHAQVEVVKLEEPISA